MIKLYLSGPMSGIRQFNIPAFQQAAAKLRARGYDVIVPHEQDVESGVPYDMLMSSEEGRHEDLKDSPVQSTWGDFLARDVKLIADGGIQGIVVLPDWQLSRGARLEVFVGLLNELPIYEYSTDDPLGLIRLDEASAALYIIEEWG